MAKVLMGPQTWLYPMPALLVGADVDGRANFMAVAWGGIANGEPPMLSVAIRHSRHTLKGIRESQTFSVNVPACGLVKETDYCGIESGARVDKAAVCRFKVFYGKLENAPLIEQCPINLECRVAHILELDSHALVIGRIEETHVSESCLTDGKPDVAKMMPFSYVSSPASHYRALGEVVASAFSVGKELK
jgi:flavin reductase (DIM6/NTAB) family NADH-FMN oxidoreductase RutF